MNITIPLNKTTIFRDKQLYGDFITLNRTSTLQVDFNEIRENLSFVIIQVHSHLYNVTLYKNVKLKHTLLNGTNIGLHSENEFMKTDKFYVENKHNIDLKLYIAVHGYFEYGKWSLNSMKGISVFILNSSTAITNPLAKCGHYGITNLSGQPCTHIICLRNFTI